MSDDIAGMLIIAPIYAVWVFIGWGIFGEIGAYVFAITPAITIAVVAELIILMDR